MIDWLPCILHLDQCLSAVAQDYPTWVWAVLFLVIFAETGLVIFPFLPGDSLLFITGTIAATGVYSPHSMAMLLILAAILGDSTNFFIGKTIGHHLTAEGSRWQRFIKPKYIQQTDVYFERYGMFTIIIGRFAPIIRTFAPFLAGLSHMKYHQFIRYSVVGSILWVVPFMYAGYYFGQIPLIKQNLSTIMLGIIIISVLPIALQLLRVARDNVAPQKKLATDST